VAVSRLAPVTAVALQAADHVMQQGCEDGYEDAAAPGDHSDLSHPRVGECQPGEKGAYHRDEDHQEEGPGRTTAFWTKLHNRTFTSRIILDPAVVFDPMKMRNRKP